MFISFGSLKSCSQTLHFDYNFYCSVDSTYRQKFTGLLSKEPVGRSEQVLSARLVQLCEKCPEILMNVFLCV